MPASLFELGARVAVGAVVWMGFWWITVPVSPAVTAFVPIVVNALFGVLPMGGVISNYFSEIVVLLLGAELLAIAWQATGFDRRLSLKALCVIGPSATQQIVIWFVLPAALSTVLPKQNGAPLVTWEKAERSIGWNLLFLIAGGMAVGGMISDSGAAYGQKWHCLNHAQHFGD